MIEEHKHWQDVDLKRWQNRWPHFHPKEVCCKSDGSIHLEWRALDTLENLRKAYGKPLTINSAYRTPSHNRKVGGSPNSQHVLGRAFDISTTGLDQDLLFDLAVLAGFKGIGRYKTFLHVDVRDKVARW